MPRPSRSDDDDVPDGGDASKRSSSTDFSGAATPRRQVPFAVITALASPWLRRDCMGLGPKPENSGITIAPSFRIAKNATKSRAGSACRSRPRRPCQSRACASACANRVDVTVKFPVGQRALLALVLTFPDQERLVPDRRAAMLVDAIENDVGGAADAPVRPGLAALKRRAPGVVGAIKATSQNSNTSSISQARSASASAARAS